MFCKNCGEKIEGEGTICNQCEGKENNIKEGSKENTNSQTINNEQDKATMPLNIDNSLIGEFQQNYEIVSKLGKTKSSEVYLVKNKKLGNTWVIKKILLETDTGVLMPKEYEILKDLQHERIPKIVDINEDDKYMYLVEEYIEGSSIKELMATGEKLNPIKAIDYICQLCDIMDYLHSKKESIVHRDIKPSNIIINKKDQVNLIDFGIARVHKKSAKEDTIILGTSGYASPEQHGLGQTNQKSDIYSMGRMLYYMLTAINPSKSNFIMKPFSKIGLDITSKLFDVIVKCTKTKASERYEDVKQLKEDLLKVKLDLSIDNDTMSLLRNQLTEELKTQYLQETEKKKKSKKIYVLFGALVISALIIVLYLSGVFSEELATEAVNNYETKVPNNFIKSIKLSEEEIELKVNEQKQLNVTITPEEEHEEKVIWEIDNSDVATVDDVGNVTAISEGSATITVMNLNNTVSDACIVHVSMPVEVESISINKEELTLIEGSEEKLSVSIHPSDADNKEVIWESDNTEVATVDKDGNITGIKPGEALISVKSVDGEKAVSCHVIIEKKSILNNLNYKMTNRRNKHAGKELLLTPNYIYYNQDGKLYKSDYDGNNKVMLTDILMSKSEIQIIDEYIYFFGKKEGKNYFYKIKSDGSQQAELISRNKQIGSLLGCAYYKGLNCVIKYGIADMFVYRDKLYFQYAVKYRYRYSDYCDAWYIASYDPAKDKFDGELRKGLDITRNSTTWHYYDEIWLGSGFLFYSDTYDTGFFKKPINKESTLLSNVAPSNILSDETHVYYIDLDYNSLNRMTLEGTLSQKLMDNVSYFTMTDFNEIIFVSGGKVYIVDKEFETQPRLIAEGIDKFIYAGDYLYYYQPDLSIKRIVIETGEEQLVTAGIQQ